MPAVLSLNGWASIAQYVFTLTAGGALVAAVWQLKQNAAAAQRDRTHTYTDGVTSVESLDEWHRLKAYWRFHRYSDFQRLPQRTQIEMLRLPNLLDEVGAVYNGGGLDRDLAADLFGVYAAVLWEAAEPFIEEMRYKDGRPLYYKDWETMQDDSQRRLANPLAERPDPGGIAILRWVFSAKYRRENRWWRWL